MLRLLGGRKVIGESAFRVSGAVSVSGLVHIEE